MDQTSDPKARKRPRDSDEGSKSDSRAAGGKLALPYFRCSSRGRNQSQKHKPNSSMTRGKKQKQTGRQWNGSRARDRNVNSRVPELEGEKEERRPKKKVACFIGYSGEGYHGMQ